MEKLEIPISPQAHAARLAKLLGPLADHPHWARLVHFIVADRAPLIYTGSYPGEDQNLSNWFCLLNTRNGMYPTSAAGRLVQALYVAHELAHMMAPTPHDLAREEFAEAFHQSERLASYETELRVYDDMPELMDQVPWTPLLARWLAQRGAHLGDVASMLPWRDSVVANPALLADDLPVEAARLGLYGDNHGWARSYWDRLDRLGWWASPLPFTSTPLGPENYRDQLAAVNPDAPFDEEKWIKLVLLNVRRAWRLCGLEDPHPTNLAQARQCAHALDGFELATDQAATEHETTLGVVSCQAS